MPWISKREIAYYLVLKSAFGYSPFNIGSAMDILRLLGPRRVARKVLKRLLARGMIERLNSVTYRLRPLDEALENLLANYIASRLQKYLKSCGIEVATRVANSKTIEVVGCSEEMKKLLNSISWRGIEIKCVNNKLSEAKSRGVE
ncbi:MAG: hypothetical protein GXO32_00570 [Crenarchaeota archaeon]|nr:hypothetical protein [Thermoproteota archaeon]